MKKLVLKPGFEFIFSLSLIIVLGLPPMLLAQNNKDVDIKIVNGDTTVNGKNIKNLSADDRREALKDLRRMGNNQMSITDFDSKDLGNQRTFSFKRKDSIGGRKNHTELRRIIIEHDSAAGMGAVKPDGFKRMDRSFSYKFRGDDVHPSFRGNSGMMNLRFDNRNSQNFDYMTTDNEGITTHARFHVTEITNEDLKKMPHVEGGKFEITDLNLVPEFSTGKTLLLFNLPAKTVAAVKLTDSQGKLIFEEKTSGGNFKKTFPLGLNGIYYLQVKQGNNIAIKKIIKEE